MMQVKIDGKQIVEVTRIPIAIVPSFQAMLAPTKETDRVLAGVKPMPAGKSLGAR
jgi:hypothetical protein